MQARSSSDSIRDPRCFIEISFEKLLEDPHEKLVVFKAKDICEEQAPLGEELKRPVWGHNRAEPHPPDGIFFGGFMASCKNRGEWLVIKVGVNRIKSSPEARYSLGLVEWGREQCQLWGWTRSCAAWRSASTIQGRDRDLSAPSTSPSTQTFDRAYGARIELENDSLEFQNL